MERGIAGEGKSGPGGRLGHPVGQGLFYPSLTRDVFSRAGVQPQVIELETLAWAQRYKCVVHPQFRESRYLEEIKGRIDHVRQMIPGAYDAQRPDSCSSVSSQPNVEEQVCQSDVMILVQMGQYYGLQP